nr:MAG TPA: hypothetical protein [Caudoviricetes sp.]
MAAWPVSCASGGVLRVPAPKNTAAGGTETSRQTGEGT